jgi:predicted transcriptional regulator
VSQHRQQGGEVKGDQRGDPWRELGCRTTLLGVNNRGNIMRQATILSISLSSDLRARLDAEAGRARRSRSFVVAEAVREYLDRRDQGAFDQARDRTLRDGLALSPAERLKLSEELWRELARGREPAAGWTAAFDTFEEYEHWRRGGAGAG